MPLESLWAIAKSALTPVVRRRRKKTGVEGELEPRIVLTVSAYEQLFLELINRARANPTAEAARFGIDLNEGLAAGTIPTTAVQPLALNDALQASIQGHLQDMITNDFFSHTGSNGSTPTTRAQAAGYTNYTTLGENLAYRASSVAINTEASVIQQHQDLFVDVGVTGRGHRKNILNANFKEAGSGVVTGDYRGLNAVMTGNDFGAKTGNSFLTGVAYSDSVRADNFYNVGEGLAGLRVVVTSGATVVTSTTSNAAGGYQVQIPAGTYTVTFSGTGLSSPVVKTFTIGSQNVKVDANARTDVPTAPSVAFSAATYSVNEADGTRTITVNLSRAATGPVTVRYTTANGTATAGSDYTATAGTLTFAAGETSKTFSIPVADDTAIESAETINLTLSSPTGATLGSQSTATVSIVDNDVPSVNFQVATKAVSELTTAASFNVILSAAFTKTVTVNFALTGGTATRTTDFGLTNGTLTFAPGQTSKTISFTVVNDILDEDDETIQISLSAPANATLGRASVATYTILDNDVAPVAKFNFRTSTGLLTSVVSVAESIATLNVPIVLAAPAGRSLTVNLLAATGGTATNGTDFSIPVGSVTFAPGEISKTLSLTIREDLLDEVNETIKLALSSTTATIGTGSTATVTIVDNDAAPTVSFKAASSSGRENIARPDTVRVALSAPSGQNVTVRYAVTTTGTNASAIYDFTLAAGTLTFLPGEIEKIIPLVLKNDTLRESTETIRILLSSPVNATLGTIQSHVFSILDDESIV